MSADQATGGRTSGADEVRLLIVDDHDMFADSLRVALSAEPDLTVVGTAATLAQARSMVVSTAPDVVLLDHRLPDGLGVDSIAELKTLRPDAKIVVLTAVAEDSMLVTATEAGCAGFILKTSPLDELVTAVRTAAAGEIMVSSELLARLLNRLHHQHERPAHDLTGREREILELIAEGLTNGAIAKRLFISVNTVRNHVQSVLAKLDAHSKLEALSIAIREGLIDPPGASTAGMTTGQVRSVRDLVLDAVLHAAPMWVFGYDRDGTCIFSEGARAGLAPGDVVGANLWDYFADDPGLVERMRRPLRGETFLETAGSATGPSTPGTCRSAATPGA